jgi:hypothetical protein
VRLAALFALLLAACREEDIPSNSADPCAFRVQCPNDRADERIAACRAIEVCISDYQPYFACLAENQVCDGAGGLDEASGRARCAELAASYEQCIAPPDASTDTATEGG